jgi:hypothetical protein
MRADISKVHATPDPPHDARKAAAHRGDLRCADKLHAQFDRSTGPGFCAACVRRTLAPMTRTWLGLTTMLLACASPKEGKVEPTAAETPKPQAPAPTPSSPPDAMEQALLSLSGLEPTEGTADGGQIVVIRGRGFNAVVRDVKVYFGTKAGAVDRVVGDGEIRVATPAGTEGEAVDVRVMFEPGGELRLPGAYTYGPRSGAPLVAARLSKADAEAILAKLDQASLDGVGVMLNQGTTAAAGASAGLTAAEIDKVIKARAGLLKACYQKELAKKPGLEGKLVVSFTIAADGTVSRATRNDPASTLRDDDVTSCILRQFQRMSFPARGGGKVTYPLIFSSQE